MWEHKFKIKLCLLGDGGTGKTSLVRRFVFNEFDDKYLYTLGTNVSKKDVVVDGTREGTLFATLMVWDIMGQQTFLPLLAKSYFEGADCGLAVCDVTREETLSNLRSWITSLRSAADSAPVAILANKCDLVDQTRISEDDVARLASEFDAPYVVTSAKTGENVEEAFEQIALRTVDRTRVDIFKGDGAADMDSTAQ